MSKSCTNNPEGTLFTGKTFGGKVKDHYSYALVVLAGRSKLMHTVVVFKPDALQCINGDVVKDLLSFFSQSSNKCYPLQVEEPSSSGIE
ncbi:hypothetical protein OUZ56_021291 [Daphnia magna]|uniref:Uncharacterized protein n=1 Tax=Daphnia magna TaxID=35525 RepID=A0ABQ9ZH03_9CRUS|nr:hypothetical protein OUZ56_021291 [Daphnia magna]